MQCNRNELLSSLFGQQNNFLWFIEQIRTHTQLFPSYISRKLTRNFLILLESSDIQKKNTIHSLVSKSFSRVEQLHGSQTVLRNISSSSSYQKLGHGVSLVLHVFALKHERKRELGEATARPRNLVFSGIKRNCLVIQNGLRVHVRENNPRRSWDRMLGSIHDAIK